MRKHSSSTETWSKIQTGSSYKADFMILKLKPRLTSVTGEAGDSSSPSWLLLLILLGLSGSSFIIASLLDANESVKSPFFSPHNKVSEGEICFHKVLPVSPVVCLINCKVWDVQVISLPGTLVVSQVSPFDQVVVGPLLIHTGRETHTVK